MVPPRSAPHLLLALGALSACRATTSTASSGPSLPTPEAPASHVGDVLVRAREAPAMPVLSLIHI